MMSFRERMARFWIGRNGPDRLYHFLVLLSLALMIVNFFVGSWILYLLEIVFLSAAFFRLFSKNLYRRQRENQAFLAFFGRIKRFFALRKNKFRDRKTHIYRKCPSCKKVLRLPRVKGKHTVCCPCCNNRFSVKV